MSISTIDIQNLKAISVDVTEDSLSVDLEDGRTITVPISWFPRLVHGSSSERQNHKLIGRGSGIHWPELDEDISIENLLFGKPSGESQTSFKRWLESRKSA